MASLSSTSFVTVIVLELTTASLLHATVFYVDPEKGDMANDGSAERPWTTIQRVFEQNLIRTRDKAGDFRSKRAPVQTDGATITMDRDSGTFEVKPALKLRG